MPTTLTDRQAQLLALIVREHIASAEPVGSAALVRRFGLRISAATVRNDMAALGEAGLIHQPHTSAGRVPTVEGYRYFVEHLMRRSGLSEVERARIRDAFHTAGRDPEEWLRLSAATMARCSGAAGLVVAPRGGGAAVRRIEMIDLGDELVQVVAIMTDGAIRQWRWRPVCEVDQRELDRVNDYVNAIVRRDESVPAALATPLERAALDLVQELLPSLGQPAEPRLFHAGLTHMLLESEMADTERLEGVIELFEHGRGLEQLLANAVTGRVEVLMGGEPPVEDVPHFSFVLASFGGSSTHGLLGVVGPRRLPYERAVPAVGFVAALITRLYAGEEL